MDNWVVMPRKFSFQITNKDCMGNWVVIPRKFREDPSNLGETRKFRSVMISQWIITPKLNVEEG